MRPPRRGLRNAWITKGGTTGRPQPGLNIEPTRTFACAELVYFKKDRLNWDCVQTQDGESVWVQSRFLTFIRPSANPRVWVTHNNVPGRSKPSFAAPATYLSMEQPLQLVDTTEGWSRVQLPDKSRVWVDSGLLSCSPNQEPTASNETTVTKQSFRDDLVPKISGIRSR